MRTKQGYSGYYNDIWIRSSYEYALIKYFEYFKIEYSYESLRLQYTLDDKIKTYIPDFIVDNIIYEVKSPKDIYSIKITLDLIAEKYGYTYKIISLNELKILYLQMPIQLSSVLQEWINSSSSSLNQDNSGEKNPHFGLKHSESTKSVISEKATKRFQNPLEREKASIYGKIGGQMARDILTGVLKTKRELCQCKSCNKEFYALPRLNRKFCSQVCSALFGSKLGAQKEIDNMNIRLKKIKSIIHAFIINNKSDILSCPYNKASHVLDILESIIFDSIGIYDHRTIGKSIECKNKKEILRYMKSFAENVC